MQTKLLGHFKLAKHISGIPWMRSVCCQSRINHQVCVDKLRNPETYGIDNDMVTVTHMAKYSCNCGKTVINIEGYLADYELNGCFMREINQDKPQINPDKSIEKHCYCNQIPSTSICDFCTGVRKYE